MLAVAAAGDDDDKRLDFDAPLLSTRRLSAPSLEPAAENVQPPPPVQPRRASLPFYKSDMKTGPIGKPGIVPFVWEQTPGRPKDGPSPSLSVRTRTAAPKPPPPPGRIVNEPNPSSPPPQPQPPPLQLKPAASAAPDSSIDVSRKQDNDEEGSDEFADAMDTLSRTESFMACSIGGATNVPEIAAHSGSFATDPHVRDFMMGRFLPAAQAMASSLPQRQPPPPHREQAGARHDVGFSNRVYQRSTLPYQYTASYAPHDSSESAELELENGFAAEDDEDDEYGIDRKANGFLARFCLRNSLCLLNPVPGIKPPGRLPPPKAIAASNKLPLHGSIDKIGDEYSWEAVYKHKIVHGDCPRVDRITSESNRIMHWSESPSADGSSPHQRSGGGISPYRNEASQSPFHEGKGFLGIPKDGRKSLNSDQFEPCERDSGNSCDVTNHSGSFKGSESANAVIGKTKCVSSLLAPETNRSSSGSQSSTSRNAIDKPESQRTEINFTMETRVGSGVQLEDTGVVQSALPLHSERLDHGKVDDRNEFKSRGGYCNPLPRKTKNAKLNDCKPVQSLVPPLLPISPSESWLRKTLPSISSKNASSQSFLGIQMQSRKQANGVSAANSMEEVSSESSKPHRQIRFADILTKPAAPKSEA